MCLCFECWFPEVVRRICARPLAFYLLINNTLVLAFRAVCVFSGFGVVNRLLDKAYLNGYCSG